MVHAMVQGFALFHVERGHSPGDEEHALTWKLKKLRELDLHGAAIGQIRPIYRVHSTPGEKTCGPWQYFIDVTADSQKHLLEAFKRIDGIDCHMDGFGF